MNVEIITAADGHRSVVMDEADYLNLIDARDHAEALRAVAAGAPTFTGAELDAYLAAPTPLAFWRKRAGLTQRALADQVGISQAYYAQIEQGHRDGGISTWAKLGKVLGVRLEDLIAE